MLQLITIRQIHPADRRNRWDYAVGTGEGPAWRILPFEGQPAVRRTRREARRVAELLRAA